MSFDNCLRGRCWIERGIEGWGKCPLYIRQLYLMREENASDRRLPACELQLNFAVVPFSPLLDQDRQHFHEVQPDQLPDPG